MSEAGKQPEKCFWAVFKAQAMPKCCRGLEKLGLFVSKLTSAGKREGIELH